MKTKLIFYTFALIILMQSADANAWDSAAAKYYPLNVGNAYRFNNNDLWFNCNFHEVLGTFTVRITNLVLKPNGKTYYQFSGWWDLYGPVRPSWTYQRIDSNSMNVYAYDSTTNGEFLLDSLLGNVNSYFNCQRLNPSQPFGWYESIKQLTIFDSLRSRKQYQCAGPIIAHINYYLIEDIGFSGYSICEIGTGEEYKLIGCIIDGKVYGDTTLTSVRQRENSIPERFSLEQNYPNPFNPKTIINYSIPSNVKGQRSDVELIVYNNLGEEIVTLVNEKQNAGTYSVEFNGSRFSSGIYFYKLEAGEFSETKRMILLK